MVPFQLFTDLQMSLKHYLKKKKIEEEGQFSVIGFILDFSSHYIVNALCISILFFPENMCD